MSLDDALSRVRSIEPPALPELRYLNSAVKKIRDRWPSIFPETDPDSRERLALEFRHVVATNDWKDIRLSFVLASARAIFDVERHSREDLAETRQFIYDEIEPSRSETFLSGIFDIYCETFIPGTKHSTTLAYKLEQAVSYLAPAERSLLDTFPELLNPYDGPARLAYRMERMSTPFKELQKSGIRAPHRVGFMAYAHLELTRSIATKLTTIDRINWYLSWLMPPGHAARRNGADQAIEALVSPWLHASPSEDIRSLLVETLISMYGDPRIRSNEIWSAVSASHMSVIHRWLTREDMRFFTDVVDAAQSDNMWPPRRDFWLKLYDEGLIEKAWVAFSTEALNYARQHLLKQENQQMEDRFGWQRARRNTSLLIMKIGDKIMVDGCHSYKTHVFAADDPMAPELFKRGYDCEEIRMASRQSRAHHTIQSWSRWVRDQINADVEYSLRKRPYSFVRPPAHRGLGSNQSSRWRRGEGV